MALELPVAMRSGKKMICPGCRSSLTPVLTDGAEVDECVKCKGIWVDFIDEKAFLQIQPQVFSIDELRRLRKLYQPLGKVEPVKYRKCPVCDDLMYRRNWGGNSGVIVDRCEKHGTYFDAQEPEKIREYVALGGIEYEKLTNSERGVSNLESKLKKEVSRLDTRIAGSNHLITRIFTSFT